MAHLTQVILCSDLWNVAGTVEIVFIYLVVSINTELNQIATFETIHLLITSMTKLKIVNKNILILIFSSADWRRYED